MHEFSYHNGCLTCEKVDLETLADQVGTPTYVYSAATLRNNFRRMRDALAPLNPLICYAVKANSNLAVLDLLSREGAGFDIVSEGELYRVLRAGGRATRCTFAGVGKSVSEIESALREGVFCLNVESEGELERIDEVAARLGVQAPVAVRVNPDVDAGTHEFISTGKSKNKFGIGLNRAADVYAAARSRPHLRIKGIQTHIGSQILSIAPIAEAIEKLLPLVNELKNSCGIEFFSVGGGMGIAYEDALASGTASWWESRPDALTPESYAEALVPLLQPLGLQILFEPGRSLAGNAGVLLTSVEYIKKTPAKNFVIVDGAMNDLIRPALYDGWHQIVPLRRKDGEEVVDIVGPVCESADFFAKDRALPPFSQGDRLAVMSAGAYGAVMASNYNSRPLAAEVLVDGEEFHVIRRRQQLTDLIAGESIPGQ